MALFNSAGTTGLPPSVYEVPGKIYIFGQAHDAETLTPIFGDVLRGVTATNLGMGATFAMPMVSLTHRSISPLNRTSNYSPDDRARSISNTKVPLYSSITFPNGDYLSIGAGAGGECKATKYSANGELIASTAMPDAIYGSELAFFHEDEVNVYTIGSRGATDISYAAVTKRIGCINKTTLVVSTVAQPALTTPYGTYGNTTHVTPLWKDADGAAYVITNVVISPATNGKQWVATQISKGGIVRSSAIATNIETTGAPVGLGNSSSSCPVYLSDDEQFIYFMTATNHNSIATHSDSKQFLFIGKIDKQTLTISNVFAADSTVSIASGVDFDKFKSLYTNFASGKSVTYDVRELRRTPTTAYFMMTIVKGSSVNMNSTMTGTGFSLVVAIDLADISQQTIVDLFQHRPNVGCSGIMPINQEGDQFIVSYDGAGADFIQYSHASNKITKREQLEFPMMAAMVDQMGRIWAQDGITTALHLFSPTISSTIRVGFADRNMKYNGIPVDSNIVVSAFNHTGDRVANNVTLTLEGTAASFAGGEKTITVMTSPSSEVLVPYTLTSNGYVRVTAVVAV